MDPCVHGEDPLDQKNTDGRMDRRTAFQLYIVDVDIYIYILYACVCVCVYKLYPSTSTIS